MKTATQAPSAPRRARRALLVSSAAGAAGTAFCSALLLAAPAAHAGMVTDQHGNVGYDTAQECDAAVLAGTARFYQPVTTRRAVRKAGEASVRPIRLSELASASAQAAAQGYSAADYSRGACDLGIRHVQGRYDITPELVGKYVPFSPDMRLNLFSDAAGQPVRVTMGQCDNGFSGNLPRPVPAAPVPKVVAQAVPNQCLATILIPARFETRTEQILKAPATRREELVPATYKTVTEQVLVSPEMSRQVPVPAELRTVAEDVVVRPAGTRDEPVPPTFKTRTEQLETQAATTRVEVVPATYKTVMQKVEDVPAHTIRSVIPAEFKNVEERVMIAAATTRTETVPATYRTEVERILVRPEVTQYVPVTLPMRGVPEQRLLQAAGVRAQAMPAVMRTVVEPVEVRAATVQKQEVPAAYEIVTEQVKVSEPYREWRRGRAWVGQAIDVVPLRGFVVDATGQFRGYKVEGRTKVAAATGGPSRGVIDTGFTPADNAQLEDDVMCLVEIPAQYQTVTRKVLKAPATTTDIAVPAEYRNIAKQVVVRDAGVRLVPEPARYHTVWRQEVDLDKARELGFQIAANGEVTHGPGGEPLARASAVAGQPGVAIDRALAPDTYVRAVKIAAEYRNVNRYVVDQPATVRVIDVPAAYRTIVRRVEVAPARVEDVAVPATYKTVPTRVVDTPERTRVVAVPAEHQAVTYRELDTPAALRPVPVPALVQRIEHQEVAKAASVRDEVVPAVYRTETRQVIDQPASTHWVDAPAEYETITRQVKVAEAREVQREVMCETNAAPDRIMAVQHALQGAGFNPGPVNGVLAQETLNAVARYQQARGLPVNGYLDIDTVRALGVAPN